MVMSAIAMIDAPAALILRPVQLAQDLAGVAPLLYLGQPLIVKLWLSISVVYLIAGFVLLAFKTRRPADRLLLGSVVLFAMIALHNIFTRNWTNWFGTPIPAMFSHASFAVEAVVFLVVPLTLLYAILTVERPTPS